MRYGARTLPAARDELYLSERALAGLLAGRARSDFSPFERPPDTTVQVIDLGGRRGRAISPPSAPGPIATCSMPRGSSGRLEVVIAGASEGSLERLRMVLADHGVEGLHRVQDQRTAGAPALAVLPLAKPSSRPRTACWPRPTSSATGFSRPTRRARRSDKFIAEVAALGDLVDHGIGRYDGGEDALELGGAPHDCLRLL